MHTPAQSLKPLSSATLTHDENTIISWIRSAKWEIVADAKEPRPLKAKVPEFFKGVRLYHMHTTGAGNASIGPLELFIKKMGLLGVLSKQTLYPVSGHGSQPRYLTLAKTDLENLGVGKPADDDED